MSGNQSTKYSVEKVCPVCGKHFIVSYVPDYAYKLNRVHKTLYYCSYTCFRKDQKEWEEQKKYKWKGNGRKKQTEKEKELSKQVREQKKVVEEMVEKIKHVVGCMDEMQSFKEMQKPCTTQPYNQGFYNGLEFALSLLEKREPVYLSDEDLRANETANKEPEQIIKTVSGKVKL